MNHVVREHVFRKMFFVFQNIYIYSYHNFICLNSVRRIEIMLF